MNNQYMESYVQFGIAGVAVLMMILLYVIYGGLYYRDDTLVFAAVLFTLAFLTESVLEIQSGILLFVIIISGEWIYAKKQEALRNALKSPLGDSPVESRQLFKNYRRLWI